MRLLVDSHALLWAVDDPRQLSALAAADPWGVKSRARSWRPLLTACAALLW